MPYIRIAQACLPLKLISNNPLTPSFVPQPLSTFRVLTMLKSQIFSHASPFPHFLDRVVQFTDAPTRLVLSRTCLAWAECYAEYRARSVKVESCFFELQEPWRVLVMESRDGKTRWRPAGVRELRQVVVKEPIVQCVQTRASKAPFAGRCTLVVAAGRPRQHVETWLSPGGYTLRDIADIQMARYGGSPACAQMPMSLSNAASTDWDRELLADVNCWRPVRERALLFQAATINSLAETDLTNEALVQSMEIHAF